MDRAGVREEKEDDEEEAEAKEDEMERETGKETKHGNGKDKKRVVVRVAHTSAQTCLRFKRIMRLGFKTEEDKKTFAKGGPGGPFGDFFGGSWCAEDAKVNIAGVL